MGKMGKDLRVIKTEQTIQSHFLSLLKEHSFQDITIKLLISECQINRSTFYRNYEDKYDLVNAIAKNLMEKFEKALRPQFVNLDTKNEDSFKPYFLPLLNYFDEHKERLLLMCNKSLPVNIFDEMLSIYSKHLLNELIKHYHIPASQFKIATYFSQIIASNILTAMKWWHLESPQSSKEEMLNIIVVSVTNGIFASLQSQFQPMQWHLKS